MVVPSKDGCWVFVSLTGGRGGHAGMAVLQRSNGQIRLSRVVPLESAPTGIALTHDGRLLIAAAGNSEVFLDVQQMTSGGDKPVAGSLGGGRGSIYANVTADDRLLFISEEGAATITVIDLERARRAGYTEEAIIGKIPVGLAPIALTFSHDGKWLYTTSEGAMPDWNWPKACKPEGANVPDTIITRPEGAVVVVDVERAKTDPAHAVKARIPAGCSPVRMAISPKGDQIYVTARNSNAVVAFDTARLISDSQHAQIAMAPAGDAPVPVAVLDGGKTLIAGNSNRFAGGDAPQSLVVLDAERIRDGMGAVVGIVPAGSFPREMSVSSDGRTLFLTNFGSQTLQVMDVKHLPVDKTLPPEIAANAAALTHRGEHKPVTVDPKVLASYEGVYQIDKGPAMVVWADGSDLKVRMGIQMDFTAIPASENTFFLPTGLLIEFPKGHARPDFVTVHQGKEDSTAKRMGDAAAKGIVEAAAAFDKRLKEQKPAPGSEQALRKLVSDLQAGKPDESMISANGYLHEQLANVQEEVKGLGTVQSIEFQRVGPAGPDIYLVKSDRGSRVVRIWLAPDGKVQSLILQPGQAQ